MTHHFLKTITSISLLLTTISFPLPALSETIANHTITEVSGNVRVKKPNWKTPQPANDISYLQSEDILIVPPNGSIKVYCSDKNMVEFKQGRHQVSTQCKVGSIVTPTGTNNLQRDPKTIEELANIPYLITPRETTILTTTPQLRWNKVPNATFYIIEVSGRKPQPTNETQITYRGEPLKEGRRYQVTITTNNGKKESVGFAILNQNTINNILQEVETIQQQPLSSENKALILAKLYRSYNLYSDAINQLETLIQQDNQNMIAYQLLGDTYLTIGLPQLAKGYYEKGLNLAQTRNSLPLQAEIKTGLGITYLNLGNKEKGRQLLNEAKTLYTQLEDVTMIQKIEQLLSES